MSIMQWFYTLTDSTSRCSSEDTVSRDREVTKLSIRVTQTIVGREQSNLTNNTAHVMDLEWDYHYYQPWSNNEQLIQQLMDNNVIMEKDDKINDKIYNFHMSRLDFEQDIRLTG